MDTHATTHATLLVRLRDGADAAAWHEFHGRYGELIRGFARRRGLQAADCDDVVQDVMLSMSKSMPRFRYDPGKGKFRSYLKTVTLHAIFKKSHQKRGEATLGEIEVATRFADSDVEVEEAWENQWRQYHLRLAMRVISAEFGDVDRRAFHRYAIEGRDARATAEVLGLSLDQVYQAKSRIAKRLARLINRQVQEEG